MSIISIAEASRQFSQVVNRAAYGKDVIVLTSRGQPKAVLLGMDAFQRLVGLQQHTQRALMPLDQFQQEFRAALQEAGYETAGQIVDLVRSVKQEMIDERISTNSATSEVSMP